MTPVKPGMFRTRLKDEPESPSPKRLTRASSSPNISKLLEEEEADEKENTLRISRPSLKPLYVPL